MGQYMSGISEHRRLRQIYSGDSTKYVDEESDQNLRPSFCFWIVDTSAWAFIQVFAYVIKVRKSYLV